MKDALELLGDLGREDIDWLLAQGDEWQIISGTEVTKEGVINANLVYLALGKQKLDLPPQDLVYSIGLIDYFNDKFVIGLMNYVHGLLKPGGKIILGNFHPKNTTKVVMDHVLDWKLIHRSEADMDRLYAASLFAKKCTQVRFEARGVNLFAECVK